MSLSDFSRSDRLDIKYFGIGINQIQKDGEEFCLQDFFAIANRRATYTDVEEAMTDADIADIKTLEDGRIEIGCRVANCGLKVLVEPNTKISTDGSCNLLT